MPITDAERFAALSPDEQAAALASLNGPKLGQGGHTVPTVYMQPAEPVEPDLEAAAQPDQWVELDDFYDDTLRLRNRGHDYTIPAADIELGLLCRRMVEAGLVFSGELDVNAAEKAKTEAVRILGDDDEQALYRRLLGGDTDHPAHRPDTDVWAQLKTEGASWSLTKHMACTALVWAGVGREAAVAWWRSGGLPKAQPESGSPTPKTPRDRQPKAGTAATTQRRGSGSSTTKPRKRAAGTTGPKS